MLKFFLITLLSFVTANFSITNASQTNVNATNANEANSAISSSQPPQLQRRGNCMFFINIEKYIPSSIETSTNNQTLYLKGIEDLSKEGDPYFYYKFNIPAECKGTHSLGFTDFGINILFSAK